MKFLCLYKSNGEEFRLRGFGNALRAAEHDFVFWRPEDKPTFDAFDEFNPDVFIGTTFDLTRSMVKCIQERPNLKVILKGSNWGEIDKEINKAKFPVVTVTDTEKRIIEQLKKETGKPDFVFCHYHPNRVEQTMAGWREIGVEPLGIMNAADVIDYPFGERKEYLASDIAFVGGYWGYKARNLDQTIIPLCETVGKYNIKIWGNQPWPVPQFLGFTNTEMVKDIYASAKICPSISEPHSNEFGFDVIERPFKILSAGGTLVGDHVSSLQHDVFPGIELPFFKKNCLLVDYIEAVLQGEEEIPQKDQDLARQRVFEEHTYFHRMAYLLEALNQPAEANNLLNTYHELLRTPCQMQSS